MAALSPAGTPLERALSAFHDVSTTLSADTDLATVADATIADLRWNDPVAFSVWSARAIRAMATQILAEGRDVVDITDDTRLQLG